VLDVALCIYSGPVCRLDIGQLRDLLLSYFISRAIICNSQEFSTEDELEGVLRALLAIVAAYLLF